MKALKVIFKEAHGMGYHFSLDLYSCSYENTGLAEMGTNHNQLINFIEKLKPKIFLSFI